MNPRILTYPALALAGAVGYLAALPERQDGAHCRVLSPGPRPIAVVGDSVAAGLFERGHSYADLLAKRYPVVQCAEPGATSLETAAQVTLARTYEPRVILAQWGADDEIFHRHPWTIPGVTRVGYLMRHESSLDALPVDIPMPRARFGDILPDGLHPTKRGHARMAEVIERSLR